MTLFIAKLPKPPIYLESLTTVSTWLERVALIALLMHNPLFLVVISPKIPLYLREQVKGEIP